MSYIRDTLAEIILLNVITVQVLIIYWDWAYNDWNFCWNRFYHAVRTTMWYKSFNMIMFK